MEFRIGDEVKQNEINSLATITKIEQDGDTIKIWHEHTDGDTGWDNIKDFTLIRRAGKKYKPKPKDYHLVIQDSCNNLIGSIKDSYKETVNNFTPEGDETYTIYQLKPVATIELAKRVKKIKKKS